MPIPNTAPLYIIKYIETYYIDGVKFADNKRLYYLCKKQANEQFKELEAEADSGKGQITDLEIFTEYVFTGDFDINEVFEEK